MASLALAPADHPLTVSPIFPLSPPPSHVLCPWIPVIAASGALAGTTYWAIIFPIDTFKSCVQASPVHGPSASAIALKLWREEGVRGYYR